MTETGAGQTVKLVQCGWCPEIMADDYPVWYLHFAEVHHYYGGYSIKPIRAGDWDIAEIDAGDGSIVKRRY